MSPTCFVLLNTKYKPHVFGCVPSWPIASVHVNQCLESSMHHLFKVSSPMVSCFGFRMAFASPPMHAPSLLTFSEVYFNFKKVFVPTWSIALVGMNCSSRWTCIYIWCCFWNAFLNFEFNKRQVARVFYPRIILHMGNCSWLSNQDQTLLILKTTLHQHSLATRIHFQERVTNTICD